jgi:predicted MFS family arabinose efflux permease
MTDSAAARAGAGGARPALMSRPLGLVFLATLGSIASFYLLLTVVPLYAATMGAGDVGAGLATAALMLATVAAELGAPRLIVRFGYRLTFAVGVLLLGIPALALPAATSLIAILTVCLVRGLGFAIIVVVGSALVASLVPHERRGEGLGLLGVVVGIPSVVALPLGVELSRQVGFGPVFVAAALVALSALVVVPGLPGRAPKTEHQHVGIVAGLRSPPLARPALVMAASAMAAGAVVTFLPLAVTQAAGNLAVWALLVQAAVSTVTRWWAGWYGDRHGSSRLLIPGLLAAASGMLMLFAIDSPSMVVFGMVLFGAGFGVCQNASLALMFSRVSASGFGTVSALWNLAYDAGLGVGAAEFGAVAAQTGYPIAFALTAALMFAALVPAVRDRAADAAAAASAAGV